MYFSQNIYIYLPYMEISIKIESKVREMEKIKVGVLFLQVCIVLAILTGSYALWTRTLYIDGTVETGQIHADLNVLACYDSETEEENISEISAKVEDATMHILITNAYPDIQYTVEFELSNTGSIPLRIYQYPLDETLPGTIMITNFTDQKLLCEESTEGNITVQLNDSAEQYTTYYFQVVYAVYQWNDQYSPSQKQQDPIARAEVPDNCYQNETITLDGSDSYDPDGTITLYEWDFNGDGLYDWSSETTGCTTHTYTTPGSFTAILQVTDETDNKNTDSQDIVVQSVDLFVDDDFDETTVGWNTTHYDTIQSAINAGSTGTIYIYNGIYHEQITLNKSLHLIGENTTHTIIDAQTPLNIGSYQIRQYDSTKTYTIPENTCIQPDGYVILARDAIQEAFESYWNTTLPGNTVYIDTNGDFPSINGEETFELFDPTGISVDGPSGLAVVEETTTQRTNTTADATFPSSWSSQPLTNATPGYGATGDNSAGLTITEYADTIGTGNYVYEYVELYYDASGTGSVVTITADNNSISRCTITHSGSNTDDAGIKLMSNNTTIKTNKICANTKGIYIFSGQQNMIYNNIFENTINAWDAQTNSWNHTKIAQKNIIGGPYIAGNFWHDYIGIDSDFDGIGETPYEISGGANKDYYPLITA